MLSEHPVDLMLLAPDLAAARDFYADKVGLEIVIETDEFVTFACGGDSRLVLTASSTGTSDTQQKACWRVDDLGQEVAGLRARGVEIEEYDETWLKTVDGIADVGFALSAWFNDPAGNNIGLLQFKDKSLG